MTSFMCFRPSKKHHQNEKNSAYGVIKDSSNANVAPSSQMVSFRSSEGLSLHMITPRLYVLYSPEGTSDRIYTESLKTNTIILKNKHNNHYKVWNVSNPRKDIIRCLSSEDVGWPSGISPPLDRLCAICKQLEQWLSANSNNIAVIHCKGDGSRAACVISAFMHYNVICSNDDSIEDRFNMQRFADKFIGGTGQPSHKRYIGYFSSLLSGQTRVNPSPIYLHRITITQLTGRTLYFKVYERMEAILQTIPITSKDSLKIDIDQEVRLRGDILIKCKQITSSHPIDLFQCQINTCALDIKGKTIQLIFHKEQLDSIFNDPSIDNGVVLELLFGKDVQKLKEKRVSVINPSNSYEDFNIAEDESTPNVEYSEIKKKNSIESKNQKEKIEIDTKKEEQKSEEEKVPQDGLPKILQNGKENIKNNKEMAPPPVPPKPRSSSVMAEPIQDGPAERRGVLPAQIRPLVHRPPSPREGRATPSIEPDLVSKERYDKASKCFSYAPAKALNEAFEKPRRPSLTRTIERKEDEVNNIDPSLIDSSIPFYSTDLIRREESPKWDDQVENAKQSALLEELARIPTRSQSVAAQPYHMRSDDTEQYPLVVDQAQRAVTTPTNTLNHTKKRGTNYSSYRTLNDEAYNSDMDDLCDPAFYMNYSESAPLPLQPSSTSSSSYSRPHAGAKSVELPRKNLQHLYNHNDPFDDIINSTPSVPAISCTDLSNNRDQHRTRNCRSVAAVPSREKKLFAESYDAVENARTPDDWLSNKLRKVRSKRDMDPDLVRRRTQEKMLLEELKNAHDEKESNRERIEADYSTEGMGSRQLDPLAEYRREEERLKNTHSPFDDNIRRGRAVRGKPPTPPPRDRSRSPSRSERATPSIDSHYRQLNGHAERDDFDFSTLNSIVTNNTSSTRDDSRFLNRRPSFGTSDDRRNYGTYSDINYRSDTPTKFFSGQERVAAAIYRAETPSREATMNRAETPNRYYPENSTMAQRSTTPAFPISRETPIPFHPLLYNQNGSRNDERGQTLNYRSSSPRSQYHGQLSRRSSQTSIDTSEIIHHHPVFVKDTSKYWYKPNISREQAISMLRDKSAGTFVVRDSNSFPGAFGLALKVSTPPPGVSVGDGTELVRHFLIEPSPKGVKLKGCNNEPVFGSLSALVYQHSITPLALPTRLILPDYDPATTPEHVSATQALLEQGAACSVAYIGTVDVESLTGSECVKRAVGHTIQEAKDGMTRPVSVHFKVSSQGVTLTDNTRKVFFRRHFPVNSVIYAGMDPVDRRFDNRLVIGYHDSCVSNARLFAFVARKPSSTDNLCHVFAEFEPEQPSSAVVNFINKVMLSNRRN